MSLEKKPIILFNNRDIESGISSAPQKDLPCAGASEGHVPEEFDAFLLVVNDVQVAEERFSVSVHASCRLRWRIKSNQATYAAGKRQVDDRFDERGADADERRPRAGSF